MAEYVILAATLGAAVIGLFIGFSGSLAFLFASLAASATAHFGWTMAAESLPDVWTRGAAVAVAALLAFGIVRWIVKKTVHGVMAQPGDAIFGALVAGAVGFCFSAGGILLLATLGFIDETSVPAILSGLISHVGG